MKYDSTKKWRHFKDKILENCKLNKKSKQFRDFKLLKLTSFCYYQPLEKKHIQSNSII